MDPSAREKLAILQDALAIKKQEVSEREAKIARLKAEVEELRRRLTNPPPEGTE
jgi:hypothetical protein